MSILERLKKRFPRKEEPDPWKGYDPDAPLPPEATEEDMAKAMEETTRRLAAPRPRPPYLSYLGLVAGFLWLLGHLAALYVMAGTPLQVGILPILMVNLLMLIHYMGLLVVNIGRQRRGVDN